MYATLTLCVTISAICAAGAEKEPWTYDGGFHKATANADRIVARTTDENRDVLFEVKNAGEIQEIHEHIQFQSPQDPLNVCFCSGFPGLEWYKGNDFLAYASMQHGVALRWQGFSGDARLTKKSSEWLSKWLAKHIGFEPNADPATIQVAVEKEARQTLQRLAPGGFLEAASKGAAEFKRQIKNTDLSQLSSVKSEDEIKGDYVRAAVPNKDLLFNGLFRLLGCLPMRWEVMYRPEQEEAHEFLSHAPLHELSKAVRSAAISPDAAVRQGAARFVFLDSNDRTGELEPWIEMLAGAGYADVLPSNRRLVLRCIAAYPKINARNVLEHACEDPDDTVRRELINTLQARGGPEALRLLDRIASGKTHPRKRPTMPRDYALGVVRDTSSMRLLREPEPEGTDQEAAKKAIQALTR